MNQPLKPGSSWQTWKIQQVLSWGQGGGLYRVGDGQKTRLLKELVVPPERIEAVLQAIDGWQKLGLPQRISLEDVCQVEGRIYLLMPERTGHPLSQVARARASPPSEPNLLKWGRQICDLVLALQEQRNPLALTLLEPDHILIDDQDGLMVFNPGWNSTAPLTISQGLHKFARLLSFCASGSPTADKDLPPTLLWLIRRCLQDEYTGFAQVRQSLQGVSLESPDDLHLDDLPQPVPVRPLSRRLALALVFISLLSLLGLGLALRRGQAKYAVPAGLALAQGKRLLWLSPEGTRVGQSDLPEPITCTLASLDGEVVLLGVEGQNGLTVVERSKRQLVPVEGSSVPVQLQISDDGQQILGLLKNGGLGHWKLNSGKVRWLGEISWSGFTRGSQLTAVRDDGGALLIVPGRGLVQIDPEGSEQGTSPGIDAAVMLDQLVLASEPHQGLLVALDGQLQPVSRQKLAGPVQLFRDSYRRQLWAVDRGGLVTLWSAPGLQAQGQLQLPRPPLCAAPDPLGNLWIVSQSGRLCKLDSHPLNCQQLAQVGAGTHLAYLARPLLLKPSRL